MTSERKWFIRNIAQVPWRQFPDHFGGALSKPLVMPETAGSKHIDYRISMYQPMAHVKLHRHKVQEQVYHVLDGEGLMEIDGERHVVRKHDYIFLPPSVDHSMASRSALARMSRSASCEITSIIGFPVWLISASTRRTSPNGTVPVPTASWRNSF
jgi:quercetin dioxygenase-like cupin family protein